MIKNALRTALWLCAGLTTSWSQIVDVVVTDAGAQPAKMFQNDGTAFFEEVLIQIDLNDSKEAKAILLEDFDGDGDLDIYIAYTQANRIWFNDGFGNFTDTEQSLGATNTVALVAGDVDGDGDIDVFAGNWGSANKIWLNDGSGNFTESAQIFQLNEPEEGEDPAADEEDTNAIDMGDIDGDGDLDIVFFELNANGLFQAWLNDGAGNFTLSESTINLSSYDVFDIKLGDLDGDGDLDLYIGTVNDTPNLVYINDGAGVFSSNGQLLGSSRTTQVELGDLDNDGDLDAFIANSDFNCDGANSIWFNDGAGSFEPGQFFGNSPSMNAELADFDLDGDLDAFVVNRGTGGWPNRVWLNDGTGNFYDNGQRLGSDRTRGLAAGVIRSSQSKTDDRLLLVAGINPNSDQFTLTMENPTSSSQSIRVQALSGDGEPVLTEGITLQSGETIRMPWSHFEGVDLISLSKNPAVRAYVDSSSQNTLMAITDYRKSWKFPVQWDFTSAIQISNPYGQETEVHVRFGTGDVEYSMILPPHGSRLVKMDKVFKSKRAAFKTIQFESTIPVASQMIQTMQGMPKVFFTKPALP